MSSDVRQDPAASIGFCEQPGEMGTQKGIFPYDWWAPPQLWWWSLSAGEGGPCCFHAENFLHREARPG